MKALAPAERAVGLIGTDLTEKSLRLHLEGLPGVDAVGLEQRAAGLGSRSIKTTSKARALDTIIGLIDLTTLEGADTPGKVRSLVAKAVNPDPSDPTTPRVAAVCVYGDMVPAAVEALGPSWSNGRGDGINVAAVATAFPSGRASLPVKLADTADAVASGADEIDMVIDRGAFLAGSYGLVFDQIVAVKEACRRADGTYAHLKVILETGELNTYDNVRKASWLAILAGGDFIKTSTGKVAPAATLPVTLLMLEVVRDWHKLTGERIGVKPAGGIRSSKDAIKYLVTVAETVGEEWLDPHLFRFGASSLLNDVLLQRQKLSTGRYSGPDYVTIDSTMTEIAKSTRFLDYAPAPESTSILHLRKSYGLFIDGSFVKGHGAPFQTISPSTEKTIAEIASASTKDVDTAVSAARRAYDRTWSKLSGADRGKYLFRIARLVQERARELAVAESLDNGKPIKESRDVDVPLVAAWFFYYAGWADKLDYAGLGPNPRALGVAAQVIPWNFPLLMLAWKIAPALAAGNTVVIKPAETTPLSALIFAEILQQAELPDGVVNIITGAGDTGEALVNHPDVNKVAFTGSTAVGRAIAKSVAGTGKKVTLELGGKAANIVFDDAPVDQAVEGIVNGIFFNQGHVCCAGSRLLVQENVHDEVVERLKARLSTLRLGDPLDKNTDIGAINSREQLERIRELSDIGEKEGADRWTAACAIPDTGFWFAPTIFDNVSTSSTIAREEVFGPVLSVLTFRTPAEAIAKANNTPYGLSAGIWSDKGSKILAVADQLRAGVIWANTFNRFDPASPFGGYKESGYGREGGRHGLAAYLESSGWSDRAVGATALAPTERRAPQERRRTT